MHKKLVLFYIFFFLISFFLILLLNHNYNKYVLNFSPDYRYSIYSKDFSKLKYNNLDKILDNIFDSQLEKKKPYKIEKIVTSDSLFFDKSLLDLEFILITKNYFKNEELEKKMNDEYMKPLNEITQIFEDNLKLFDYSTISEMFKNDNNNINDDNLLENKFNLYILEKYNELLNSNFYSEYYIENNCYINSIKECFIYLSNKYKKLLHSYKKEKNNSFRVKFIKESEVKKFNLYSEIPKNLGISALLTYILFILAGKFLKRKIK